MPLKHGTETVLVFLLGLLIVLSGLALAIIPSLTVNVWPWTIGFAVTIVYPLLVYPLLKRKRADYLFRVLHLFPAVMFLVWLLLDFLRTSFPATKIAHYFYTWGFSLPLVLLGIVLLILFSLLVIRQRFRRVLLLLLLLLIPIGFTTLSKMPLPSGVNRTIASVLQYVPDSVIETALGPDYSSSDNAYEHAWRMQLRRRKRREDRLAKRTDTSDTDTSAASLAAIAANANSSRPLIAANTDDGMSDDSASADAMHGSDAMDASDSAANMDANGASKMAHSDDADDMNKGFVPTPARTTVDAPPQLAHTGLGIEFIALTLVALYCGVLHQRSRRRFTA